MERIVGGIGWCIRFFSKLMMVIGAFFAVGGIFRLHDGYSRGEWLSMSTIGVITILLGYLLLLIAKSWFFQPLPKKDDILMFVDGKEYDPTKEG